jgi:hypothetical protein
VLSLGARPFFAQRGERPPKFGQLANSV